MREDKKPVIDSEEYYGIRIRKDGTWLYNGSPITRHNMVKLFSTVLSRDERGDFWLTTPYERGRIEVEDAPFTAVELKTDGEGRGQTLSFRTNIDEWVTAGAAHPLRVEIAPDSGAPSPYIHVRGRLEALILRSVYYALVGLAVPSAEDEKTFGVWSAGCFYPIGRNDDRNEE